MDNKELQKTVNPIYLTAKGTLGLLKKAEDPDAMALMQQIGLETDLQEQAKKIPAPIGLSYKTAQLARYEIYNTAALRSSAPNIVDLLSEYGGTWITADVSILRIYVLTFSTLLKGDELAFLNRIQGKANELADVKMNQNSLFLHGEEGAIRFLEEQGFTVTAEPVTHYLPDIPGVTEELRNAYRQMNIFTMRVAAPKTGTKLAKELPFAVDSSVSEGKLVMKIQGRVDTLTATQLLKAFQETTPQPDAIELDVEKMPYISSAGLRVLLIMRKSVKDQSCFKVLHVQPEVEKILKMTGFDTLML